VLNFARKKTARSFKIFLTRGHFNGIRIWHYVKVDVLKLPLYQKAVQSGSIEVDKFGEILFSGWGENPPDEIRHKVDAMA
jgi:hypothetical protein